MQHFVTLRSDDTFGMCVHKTCIVLVRNNWWFFTKHNIRVSINVYNVGWLNLYVNFFNLTVPFVQTTYYIHSNEKAYHKVQGQVA